MMKHTILPRSSILAMTTCLKTTYEAQPNSPNSSTGREMKESSSSTTTGAGTELAVHLDGTSTPSKRTTAGNKNASLMPRFSHRRFVMTLTLALCAIALFGSYRKATSMQRKIRNVMKPSVSSVTRITLPQESGRPQRLAVASFLDNAEHLFGTYSILRQMNHTGMDVPYVVVVSDQFAKSFPAEYAMLLDMIGEENAYLVNRDFIIKKIREEAGLWKGTFNKLWIFNLTDYDKVIMLDQDVFIRTNIMHWFDYPAPAATQAGDNIEWNSGAMVIEPNRKVFEQMIDLLPNITKFDGKREATSTNETNDKQPVDQDNWSSGNHGDQGFFTSYFTQASLNKTSTPARMNTMPTEAAILSSSLARLQFHYIVRHRLHILETIHFTVDKPWKERTKPTNPTVCAMLREWKVSMRGFEKYNATIVLEHDYLQRCPPPYRHQQGNINIGDTVTATVQA